MEHNEQHDIKTQVLGKIRSGNLKMHPRYYFMVRVAALALLTIAILLFTIFICNFILFSIRINSSDSFLYFGPRGWGAFLASFPWEFLAVDAGLAIVLLRLLREFKFGYKSPFLFIAGGLVLLTIVAGVILDRATDFNDRFLRGADAHELPSPLGEFYRDAHRLPPPGEGSCRCTVVSVNGNAIIVSDLRASTTPFTVMVPAGALATTSGLEPGDVIFIAGDRNGGMIQVFGIRKLDAPPMK